MVTNNQWKVLDLNFPKEIPQIGQEIYKIIVDMDKGIVLVPREERFIQSVEQMESWYRLSQKIFGARIAILWQPIPPRPELPDKWEIIDAIACTGDGQCQYCKDTCCIGGPQQCPQAKAFRKFCPVNA